MRFALTRKTWLSYDSWAYSSMKQPRSSIMSGAVISYL